MKHLSLGLISLIALSGSAFAAERQAVAKYPTAITGVGGPSAPILETRRPGPGNSAQKASKPETVPIGSMDPVDCEGRKDKDDPCGLKADLPKDKGKGKDKDKKSSPSGQRPLFGAPYQPLTPGWTHYKAATQKPSGPPGGGTTGPTFPGPCIKMPCDGTGPYDPIGDTWRTRGLVKSN